MSKSYDQVAEQNQVEVLSPTTIQLLQSAEIDQQIATAKRYPRRVTAFLEESKELATLTVETAMACNYAIPRDGKTIEGPTARLAEIIASQWGNCRYGARIVAEDERFVTAQGVFHDLEHNSFVTFEVKRRITTKQGRRYSDDMISVTSNAACSIALRNAVFKGVPKAVWEPIYIAARRAAAGDEKTLSDRRENMLSMFKTMGVSSDQIYGVLDVKGKADIGMEELVRLGGIYSAIVEGETTVDEAFPQPERSTRGKASKPKPAEKPPAPKDEEPESPDPEQESKPEEPKEEGDPPAEGEPVSFSDLAKAIAEADTVDTLLEVMDLINSLQSEKNKATLTVMATAKKGRLESPEDNDDESMGLD